MKRTLLILIMLVIAAPAMPAQPRRPRGGASDPSAAIAGGPIWFDGEWKPCGRSDAMYYRRWRRVDDSTYLIRDYYLDGRIQMKGLSRTPREPLIRVGLYSYFHSNGMKSFEGIFVDDLKEGVWPRWYEDGTLQSTGAYLHGKETGLWVWYDEQGLPSDSTIYAEGKREGPATGCFAGGAHKYTGTFHDDKREGLWQWWYESGILSERAEYSGGERNGVRTVWYPDGKLKYRGAYAAEKREGTWEWWYSDGVRSDSCFYHEEHLEGLWLRWHQNGKPAFEGTYRDDHADGPWRRWFDNGRPMSVGAYSAGARSGQWKEWFRSGELAGECTFDSASATSEWTYYFKSGKVSARETYRHDSVLVRSSFLNEDGSDMERPWDAERSAEFPGGRHALRTFLRRNVENPGTAGAEPVEGTVHVALYVLEDGTVTQVKLEDGVDPALDAEALRVARLITKVRPARRHNRVVEEWWHLEVPFEVSSMF